MRTFINNDLTALASAAADFIEETMESTQDPIIGLATGSSPLAIYEELIRRHKENGLSFAQASAFTLDEYVGLPAGHPESYAQVIRDVFTSHVDIDDARVSTPDALNDVDTAPQRYEEAITAAGGIDVQILGIGSNGHIAFNEPGSERDSLTHIETLAEQTRQDNARFFDSIDQVPTHAITQGLGTIARARRLVLIATGAGKAEAVAALVKGEFDPQWPATAVAKHPDLLILLDEAAASLIEQP